jgi:predicted ester cyclase
VEHAAAPFAQSAPRRVNGPHAMRASAEWLLARFPDLHMMIEEVISDGDIEVVRILSEGTNSGLQAASWSSTGLRATILRPCCS